MGWTIFVFAGIFTFLFAIIIGRLIGGISGEILQALSVLPLMFMVKDIINIEKKTRCGVRK